MYYFLLWICWLVSVKESLCVKNENTRVYQKLPESTVDIIKRHEVPLLDEKYFMTSYKPNTGIGNRADITIVDLRRHDVKDELYHRKKWSYIRFNNTDYAMTIWKRTVSIWKDFTQGGKFEFVPRNSYFNRIYENEIKDAILFKLNGKLYLALLDDKQLKVMPIIRDSQFWTTIEVSGNPLKLTHFHLPNKVIVVVLCNGPAYSNVVIDKLAEKSEHVSYLKVTAPNAIDLTNFVVKGNLYLAVSNTTVCEVYRLHPDLQHSTIHDLLRGNNIVSVTNFRLGLDHFLAIAGSSRQHLYVWKVGGFVFKQDFDITDVVQWYHLEFPSCRDEIVLILLGYINCDVFVWRGQQKVFTLQPNAGNLLKLYTPEPGTIASFVHGKTPYLIYTSKNKTRVVSLHVKQQNIRHPYLTQMAQIAEMMERAQEALIKQERDIENILEILSTAVRSDTKEIITKQLFNKITVKQKVSIQTMSLMEEIKIHNSKTTLKEFEERKAQIMDQVSELEARVEQLYEKSKDILLKDEKAKITGRKIVTGGFFLPSLKTKLLNLLKIGKIDVAKLQEQLFTRSSPKPINARIIFEQALKILGDVNLKTINEIDLNRDVMTINTPQTVKGYVNFRSGINVRGNIDVSGLTNGIDIGKELVTLYGNHNFIQPQEFGDKLLVIGDVKTKLVNKIDIKALNQSVLKTIGFQKVSGKVKFESLEVTSSVLVKNVNDLKCDVLKNLVRIDVPFIIFAHKAFQDLVIFKEDINVVGRLNGIKIPNELMLADIDQDITATKHFAEVIATHVNVTGTVNDLHLPSDVITLSTDQIIEGNITFVEGISVDGHLEVAYIDYVNLRNLYRRWQKFETDRLSGTVVLDNVSINHISNEINIIDEIYNDAILKGDKAIVKANKEFLGDVTLGSLTLKGKINGYDLNEFFLATNQQRINGSITLASAVSFKGDLTSGGYVDGVDLQYLKENSIPLSKNGSISGPIRFETVEILDYLNVKGKINSLAFPTDVVLKSNSDIILKKTFLGPVSIHDLRVEGNVTLTGLLNDRNITDIASRRISLDGNQTLNLNLNVDRINAHTVEVLGLVNDINIIDFCRNVMSSTKNQIVVAPKEFSGTVYATNVTTFFNINDKINLRSIHSHAVKVHGNSTFSRTVTFTDDVFIKSDLQVSTINAVDVTLLFRDSVTTKGRQVISSLTTFDYGLSIKSDLFVNSVNGYDLNKDFLTKNTEQTITGNYTFTDVTIKGDLIVSGLVSGIEIGKEGAPWLTRGQTNVIYGSVVFTNVVTIKDLSVKGTINDIDINEIGDLICPRNETVCGVTTIIGPIRVSGDIFADSINGVTKQMLHDIVTTEEKQVITSHKEFVGEISVSHDITVDGSIVISGAINGLDLSQWTKELVYLNDSCPSLITGYKTFVDKLYVTNLLVSQINGIFLDELFTNCNEPQFITGNMTFHNLHVRNTLEVSGLVNNYNLQALYSDTLTDSGEQIITGEKHIKGFANFSGNVYTEVINGQNIETLFETNLTVTGDFVFETIHVHNINVRGLVNGINMTRLIEEAIYTNVTVINNQLNFTTLVVEDIIVDEYNKLLEEKKKYVQQFNSLKLRIEETIANHTERLEYIKRDLKDTVFTLDKFVLDCIVPVTAEKLYVDHNSSTVMFHNITTDKNKIFASNEVKYIYFGSGKQCSIIKQANIQCRNSDSPFRNDSKRLPWIELGGDSAFDTAIDHKGRKIIAIVYSNGSCSIYRQERSPTKDIKMIWEDTGVISVAVFSSGSNIYFAVGRSCTLSDKCSAIYEIATTNSIREIQKLPGHRIDNLLHFTFANRHYLVFTDGELFSSILQPQSVKVYRLSRQETPPFRLHQRIQFVNATTMRWFEIGNQKELYLTIANGTVVNTLRLDGESGFSTQYPIWSSHIEDVDFIFSNSNLYMIVVRSYGGSNIFKAIMRGSQWQPYHRFSQATWC